MGSDDQTVPRKREREGEKGEREDVYIGLKYIRYEEIGIMHLGMNDSKGIEFYSV